MVEDVETSTSRAGATSPSTGTMEQNITLLFLYPFHLLQVDISILDGLEELEYLPEECLQNLSSLTSLDIARCRKLRISLSLVLQHLTAADYVTISDRRELNVIGNEDEDGAQWLRPRRLRSLTIENVPNLVSLPRGLAYLTTLQHLEIMNCPSLMSLPEWIGNLTSLQRLQIVSCPNVVSLPEGMGRLTSLCNLTIAKCPHSKERCEYGTGEDWPKIAHAANFFTQLDPMMDPLSIA